MSQLFGPSAEVLAEISKMNQQSTQATGPTNSNPQQATPVAQLAKPHVVQK